MVAKYQNRLSGSILDRIDIHIDLKSVPFKNVTTQSSLQANRYRWRNRQRYLS
jgi:predicted ATPase with chaperone activity